MLIYRILNLVTDQSYIGQTTKRTFDARYGGPNWHEATHNAYLKRAVAKYGLDNFVVQVLKDNVSTEAELDILEQKYIRQFNSLYPGGYNFTGGGDSLHSLHPETRKKLSEKRSKTYDFVDWEGNEYHITHLKRWCQERGLTYEPFKAVIRGRGVSSQGYALKGTSLSLIVNPTPGHRLKNVQTGEVVTFHSIREFARERGIEAAYVQVLLSGRKQIPYAGWATVDMDLSKWQDRVRFAETLLKSPEGVVLPVGDSPEAFARAHPPLRREDIRHLYQGSAIERKGWTLASTTQDQLDQFRENRKQSGIYLFREDSTSQVVKITNLFKFCQDHQLSYWNMQKLIKGKMKRYAGFTFLEKQKGFSQKTFSRLVFGHEDGRLIEASNASGLWGKMEGIIPKNRMFDIIREKIPSFNGWTLKEKVTL